MGQIDLYLSEPQDIEWCDTNRLQSTSVTEYVDARMQEALSELKSKLSAMECTGCGGNIDIETLKCTCCGRQYRLVAEYE